MISAARLAAIRAENPDHLQQFGWLSTLLLRVYFALVSW